MNLAIKMLKKTLQLFILTLFSGLFFFCKTNNVHENKKDNQPTFQEIEITQKLHNQDKSKLLLLNYLKGVSPIITYNYKVVDTKTNKELKKGVFVGEKIEWLNLSTLKCTKHVGMIQKEDDNILLSETKNNTSINYITIKIN